MLSSTAATGKRLALRKEGQYKLVRINLLTNLIPYFLSNLRLLCDIERPSVDHNMSFSFCALWNATQDLPKKAERSSDFVSVKQEMFVLHLL